MISFPVERTVTYSEQDSSLHALASRHRPEGATRRHTHVASVLQWLLIHSNGLVPLHLLSVPLVPNGFQFQLSRYYTCLTRTH